MKKNIFQNIPEDIPEEIFQTIIETNSVKVEKIISKGQKSPDNFWYDQDKNEWVIIIKGEARVQFENDQIVDLFEGDYLNIPAHRKHRVIWTKPDDKTIWLAVFY